MRVRTRDRLEDRRIADVQVLEALYSEVVADDLAARADGMEVDPEALVDRRLERTAECSHRVVLGELERELDRGLERFAVAVVGEQAVLDRVERDAAA